MNALQRIRAALADHRYRPLVLSGAATVVALVGVLAFALLRDERTPGTPTEPPGFVLSPAGDDVPRLAPIKVTFELPPGERDGAPLYDPYQLCADLEERLFWRGSWQEGLFPQTGLSDRDEAEHRAAQSSGSADASPPSA